MKENAMSARERYIKVIESLVEGEDAKASELLHEAFVEKAREIWNDLVEADEIVEDEVAEEELEEGFGGEEADDFIDDIEEDEDEIEAEEAFGEDADEEDMDDMDAEMELSDDEGDMDFDGDGESDDHEEEHEEIEDKLMSVEDALADLKAEFAKMMGDDAEEAPEMEEELAFEADESEEELEESTDEADEEIEEATDESDEENLEEGAELKKVGKDGMHPADMPAGDDGKASPVAGKNDMGGEAVDMSSKGSEGDKSGLVDAPKDMGVTHPGDGAAMKPEPKGHGAEKKGKAE
tara:strand:- start:3121 stop:4002 length:882 start_codon:yes stop_codon:yes gene_type:complete